MITVLGFGFQNLFSIPSSFFSMVITHLKLLFLSFQGLELIFKSSVENKLFRNGNNVFVKPLSKWDSNLKEKNDFIFRI